MKETVVPPAPPPPTINPVCAGTDGSGEAPMDMDTKEDDVPPAPPAPTISGSGINNNLNLSNDFRYIFNLIFCYLKFYRRYLICKYMSLL